MKALRSALLGAASTVMVAGYAASQVAALQGWADRYAAAIDAPTVSFLSLALLAGSVLVSLKPPPEDAP